MTLVATAIATLVCGGVSALVLVGVRGQAADYEREQTTSAALRVVHVIKRERLPSLLTSDDTAALQVLNAAGRVVAATANVRGRPPIASFLPSEQSVYSTRVLCPPAGLAGCMNVVSFRVYQGDGDWIVYAADATVPWYVSPVLCLVLLGLSLLVIALAAVSTWRIVGHTLAPVDAIRAELAEITATDSGRRVPVPANRDEIRSLAETANATLDRLDAGLERQRRFTSDASHDLRSPITAARATVEEALMYPDETDWPRAGASVLESLDRLQAIVADLLELARLDADTHAGDDPVDLATLVNDELERGSRHVRLDLALHDGVVVRGDRLRLARLLTNLLDNAERHADDGVQVVVRADGDTAVLTVCDDGPGIAPADREVVFQRFARLKAARERDPGGTGLGLPIARQIARSHGGTLTIEDSPKGACFTLRVPRAPA
ncbi:sensor histidine kinase [Actinomadura hibisca]|uniref:sensor histidine kinase n=1 Tax=Actinomadura hibisca TaxID=68565 RepID=UPI000829AEEF|nr:HAMP domain-containing sensor histidine kinase [Actinomadura hibisca]